ncbi:hypothetical protein HCN44_008304 [Aphidius gifuensis]|uniref:F-box domain-containing protein n=1 Tax=Aphidius gifuensis TaxID=684658 RepID=A0A835CQY3_APHGI|nr:hypothetical protein HCN44_008304 [Aphidius gifuensis]
MDIINEDEFSMNINMLNNYCLEKIFMYLSIDERFELEKVCEKWKIISQNAWHDIVTLYYGDHFHRMKNFNVDSSTVVDYIEKILTRCGKYLLSLTLTRIDDSIVLPVINKYCLKLKILKLFLTSWVNEDFTNVFDNLKKLASLDIIFHGSYNIPIDFVNSIEALGETLESFSLTDDYLETKYKFLSIEWIPIIENFKCLNSLAIIGFKMDKIFLKNICEIKTLESLTLADIIFDGEIESIDLISNIKNLKYLSIMQIEQVDDIFIEKISNNCINLEKLYLQPATHCTDFGILNLLQLKKLNTLSLKLSDEFDDVIGITDTSLRRFSNMKEFDCGGCWNITNDSIINIINHSPELEKLNIRRTSVSIETIMHAVNITKKRTNNITLNIEANTSQLPDNFFSLKIYESPFLKIKLVEL